MKLPRWIAKKTNSVKTPLSCASMNGHKAVGEAVA